MLRWTRSWVKYSLSIHQFVGLKVNTSFHVGCLGQSREFLFQRKLVVVKTKKPLHSSRAGCATSV